nr:TOBE domain-containing protein [Geminicoccaceae bacterium]
MIYVTHDQVEAMTLADRIVVMHQGVIQQVGTPEELYRTPANLFVAGFIGSPKMNLLNGQWRGGGRIAIKGGGSVDIDASAPAPANDELVVGVRPDGLSVIDPAGADLHGKVVLNEYLGRETYLHLDLENGSPMIVEISPDLHLRQGDTVGLAVKPGAAHLFAAASEQRLAA